jgi:hypothetical protein
MDGRSGDDLTRAHRRPRYDGHCRPGSDDTAARPSSPGGGGRSGGWVRVDWRSYKIPTRPDRARSWRDARLHPGRLRTAHLTPQLERTCEALSAIGGLYSGSFPAWNRIEGRLWSGTTHRSGMTAPRITISAQEWQKVWRVAVGLLIGLDWRKAERQVEHSGRYRTFDQQWQRRQPPAP